MTMEIYILIMLALLFVKHWYVDFVNQSIEEVQTKGIYGRWPGICHSLKHGFGTWLVFWITTAEPVFALFIGLIDFVLHYHIDWVKMKWGNRDIQNPRFWNHLGLDQLAHYLTYLGLVYIAIV
jgi:hypothetical protein